MPKTILILHEAEEQVALLCEILTHEGYRAVGSAHQKHPFDLAKWTTPALIILDSATVARKKTLLEDLKRHPATAAIPVLFCSPKHRVEALIEAVNRTLHAA